MKELRHDHPPIHIIRTGNSTGQRRGQGKLCCRSQDRGNSCAPHFFANTACANCSSVLRFIISKGDTEMTAQLKKLETEESKLWNIMMNGSSEDSSTVYGKEGKNYIAWCVAADKCREYRELNKINDWCDA